jgi:AcrR family transcriptional regulator
MQSEQPVKRRYRSALREEQARATRRRIVAAAQRLFVERGFVATSMDAVAAEAGVSRATVFGAFGTKAALLKRAYDEALVGDDEPVALRDRPRSRELQSEADPRRFLEGYGAIASQVVANLAPIYEAIRGASVVDPEARKVWDAIHAERFRGATNVVAELQQRAPLAPGVDPAAAVDILYAHIDPGFYFVLSHERGWDRERFATWLAEALRRELLDGA